MNKGPVSLFRRRRALAKALTVVASIITLSARAAQLPFSALPSETRADPTLFHSGDEPASKLRHALLRISASAHLVHDLARIAEQDAGLDVWNSSKSACKSAHSQDTSGALQGCIDLRLVTHGEEDPCEMAASMLQLRDFTKSEEERSVRCRILSRDLSEPFSAQIPALKAAANQTQSVEFPEGWLEEYHVVEDIDAHLDHLAEKYPSHVHLRQLGQTWEGRRIRSVTIHSGEIGNGVKESEGRRVSQSIFGNSLRWDRKEYEQASMSAGRKRKVRQQRPLEPHAVVKPRVVVVAGAHAREWIAPAVSLQLIHSLLETLSNAPESALASELPLRRRRHRSLLETFDLVFVPLLNPDGYAHTWSGIGAVNERDPSSLTTMLDARLWRKNRQRTRGSVIGCQGIDIGRGFPAHFASSYNPCSESYSGSEPLAANETIALASLLRPATESDDGKVVAFVDLHSYGQQLTHPPAWSCDAPNRDEEDLEELSIGAASAARRVHGRTWWSGRTCDTLYASTGQAVDFAYDSGIKWSFNLELRDEGEHGFLLPATQILPSAQEAEAALGYILHFVAAKLRGKAPGRGGKH
ncbi:zinc carboxypeptidase [Ceraceosorus bombacis]|uniref:Inactive metallocarboxypeptidase ECM14 n=1 Tax=Ceraceosorus bombacis TaxID=401625 RepID=A0A0P1BJN8_9BASI|nr:zinc carboxypeptidase [Ceraceosorus bombacis]